MPIIYTINGYVRAADAETMAAEVLPLLVIKIL